MVKINDSVRTEEILRKHILKHHPVKGVFYSTSYWLNPTRVGPIKTKKGKLNNSDLYLFADLVFDIDAPKFEDAQDDLFCLAYNMVNNFGIKPSLINFSGHKGFHFHKYFFNPFENKAFSNVEREKCMRDYRIKMASYFMENYDTNFDFDITVDTRRVIRLPGSVNVFQDEGEEVKMGICDIVGDWKNIYKFAAQYI